MSAALPQDLQDLILSGPLTYLTTVGADGSPQVTMIWIGLDEGGVFSVHMRYNQKLRNIARDPRVALAFAPPQVAGDWLSPHVVLRATAAIEPIAPVGHLISTLAKAYVGPDAEIPATQTGHVVRYAIDRIAGIGSWAERTAT